MTSPSDKFTPSRRPRISREFIEEHRRRRYVDATAELFNEFGRSGPTVANIVRLAGTARNSFYDVFRNVEDCIGYGIGVADKEFFAALEALDGEGEWLTEVQKAIAAFYRAVAAHPILAELFLVHSAAFRFDQGQVAARAGAERFIPLLGRGRTEAESGLRGELPVSTEEYFSGAIVSLAARRVRDANVQTLPEDSRRMAALVGRFYLGADVADAILSRPEDDPALV